MKKKVILIVVALGLVLCGISGDLAYAQPDQPPSRLGKLTGLGVYGVSAEPTYINEALSLLLLEHEF